MAAMEVFTHLGMAWFMRRRQRHAPPRPAGRRDDLQMILTAMSISGEQLALYRTVIHALVRDPSLFNMGNEILPYGPLSLGPHLIPRAVVFGVGEAVGAVEEGPRHAVVPLGWPWARPRGVRPRKATPTPTLLGVTPTTLGPVPSILGVNPSGRGVVVCSGVSLAW